MHTPVLLYKSGVQGGILEVYITQTCFRDVYTSRKKSTFQTVKPLSHRLEMHVFHLTINAAQQMMMKKNI